MLSDAELERRKPVWLAFSDLWLHTETTEGRIRSIARVATESGYSIAELREIYLWEIAPTVYRNLRTPVGEWAGFDEAWLYNKAKRRAEHRSLCLRLLLSTGLGRGYLTAGMEEYWQQVVELVGTTSA